MSRAEDVMIRLRYIVIDVDGTLTDGGIYYDENGNEMKKFSTKDAAGFFAAREVGIKIIVMTGRECAATYRRMCEMGADYIFQNVKDKVAFLHDFISKNEIKVDDIGYIGDDLNDYESMKLCGFAGCPKDSCQEILQIADYVSDKKGGNGAVRDVIEHILRENGVWEKVILKIYNIGT
jgi:3-deoxy-D-manno-octulosonate 8-phosphate phosphatase (KDO 8-P phosphatase)